MSEIEQCAVTQSDKRTNVFTKSHNLILFHPSYKLQMSPV